MTDTMSIPTTAWPTRSTVVRPAPVARHEEHEVAPTWMRAVGAVLLLGGGALTAAVLGWPGDAPEAALLVPGLVGVVAGVLLLVARSGFTVTRSHVVLHFRPLPDRRIPRSRLAAVRLVDADAATYGGLGLRVGRGSRALILSPGTGLELTDDRGRVTFVRTRRPEAALRTLR